MVRSYIETAAPNFQSKLFALGSMVDCQRHAVGAFEVVMIVTGFTDCGASECCMKAEEISVGARPP
jgi:hypothetical protein